MKEQFIVICLTDRDGSFSTEHVQATRRRFMTRRKAQTYANGICPSRDARVVPVLPVATNAAGYPLPANQTLMGVFYAFKENSPG